MNYDTNFLRSGLLSYFFRSVKNNSLSHYKRKKESLRENFDVLFGYFLSTKLNLIIFLDIRTNMAISNKERLRRKREAQKNRRKRIQDDPERLAKENEKRRDAYARKKQQMKKRKESKKEIEIRRRRWRIAKRKYLEKLKQDSAALEEGTSGTRAASIKRKAKQRAECKRVKHYHMVKKLENRNIKLQRQVSKYKMRYYRLKEKVSNESTSPASILKRQLQKNKIGNISPEVKRRLLFGHSVTVDVGRSLLKVRSNKKKHLISTTLHLKYVKKYRFLSIAKPYFPFALRSRRKVLGVKKKKDHDREPMR